jgi:fibro-slime domain-containing protein
MSMRRLLFLALLAGLSACKQSDSVVVVNVAIDADVSPIYSLRVVLSTAQSHDSKIYPATAATAALPAQTSLAMVLPRSRSGLLDVAIEGLDVAGNSVAHGTAQTTIIVGDTATASVVVSTGPSLCGNMIIDPGETCDDGNQFSFDGCDFRCQSEGQNPPMDAGLADAAPPDTAKDTNSTQDLAGELAMRDVPYIAEVAVDLKVDGTTGTAGTVGAGGATGLGGIPTTGGTLGTGGIPGGGGVTGTGGRPGTGGVTSAGGMTGTGGTTVAPTLCGNGLRDPGEQCDCGTNANTLPSGCRAINGIFFGDSKGCSKTCTKEPTCLDGAGHTQACSTTCGDGNIDPGEECDDGNGLDGDGCSSACKEESGFACSTATIQDTSTCQSGSGQCLELGITYRDFQPENAASGGHPDFPFLGTRYNGAVAPTTICVPNSAGPAYGNDSTSRCWGIVAANLLSGKPQPGSTTTCTCQFSDWNIGNSSRIPGGYTQAASDSPLSSGAGSFQGGTAGNPVTTTSTAGAYTGVLTGYTQSSPGGPIWKGTVPAYKNATSFGQWFKDDPTVNKTFTTVLELPSLGSDVYQYASKTHLAQGGFFPLDALNPSQATLCNLWPYWNRYGGTPIWTTCQGDQYLFPPHVTQADCPAGSTAATGCWVTSVAGVTHDSYFTDEARYYFVYDGTTGMSLQFYGDDDLYIFINGVLVLDLGGIHQQLPGMVTVTGSPGDAQVTEGGCLDSAGNIAGATAGATACSPANGTKVPATTPDDFRVHTVALGLVSGKTYEIAIFGADRHPPESNYQLTMQGFTRKRSICQPN